MQIIKRSLKVVLLNLCIVALLGVILRYKIAFSLPFIDQRNLLHGHSHFAFAGWITQALMILLLYYLFKQGQENLFKRYRVILLSNLLTAYGMLISFPIEGYGFFSILFSTLNIFASYLFTVMYWKDLNKLKINQNSHAWFKAGLLFNGISSIGPYSLAFMMATHAIQQKIYLASVYFFLHFQYNGWFLFACMGLFISKLNEFRGEERRLKYIFWIFFITCIPCFFLSALWLPIPKIIYVLVVLSAIMQLVAWIWLLKIIHPTFSDLKNKISKSAKWLIFLAAISMSIKLILQLGSTHPALSQLAFGFRPIVIGYIHLVLLGVISVFILGYMLMENLINLNKFVIRGIVIFVSGIFINEILLMTQGVFALATINVSHMSIFLFIAALIMLTGIVMINIKQYGLGNDDSKQ